MADSDRSGIPSGLNRIRTRRVAQEDQSSSGGDDSPAFFSRLVPPSATKGVRRGRKIARWLSSYLTAKDVYKTFDKALPSTEGRMLDAKLGKKDHPRLEHYNSLPAGSLIPKKIDQKSFSHELGPRGGIIPLSTRAHSYSDLKELLGSLQSKFDTVKEAVNGELAAFAADVMDALENGSLSKARETAEYLLYVSERCMDMTSSELRENCESIVKKLAERRQQCQIGLVKQLSTRMLFILTRCTRLLQFQKDSATISEDSLVRFKKCLENVPVVDMDWVHRSKKDDFSTSNIMENPSAPIFSLEENNKISHPIEDILQPNVCRANTFGSRNDVLLKDDDAPPCSHQTDCGKAKGLLCASSSDSVYEQEESSDEVDSVLCRICEENVPTSHLEPHSYICAYADKCDLEGLGVDERLLNIAEILEQIVESYNQSLQASSRSPEISGIQNTSSVQESDAHSPKLLELHNKGMEGMFEDIHEMDTACIDDPQLAASNSLKAILAMKLGASHPASSNGSMTPSSTPRSNHFDLFWLEHNNPSEPEDKNQMNELADLARKAANTELSDEGASDNLGTYLHDLLDILQLNQLKALVIDTFGRRIKHLLKEKYTLAVESVEGNDLKHMGKLNKVDRISIENPAESTSSASARTLHKEKTSIEDFDIIKPISKGAFGKVFLARKRTTGDLFAIKVLKKLGMIRKNDIERILAERNILITVRNPFVVRFFYSFTCSDNLYLVMEYLNGGDLYSLLRKVGCLEEDVARIYIAELVLALEYLHSLGITHRDLKPDNILIARDGHIKLTDFGLSKIGLINSAIDLSGSATAGSILINAQNVHVDGKHDHQIDRSRNSAVGTPDYLAPEILLGNAHGFAADWWSVGIILFEFILGIPPFTDRLPEMIFENILNRKIPWPCIPDEMSFEAKDLIDRLLNQDQNLRLGSNGASEVKAHPFFKDINWDNLTLEKAVFIPHLESADDTSYFTSRYSSNSLETPIAEHSTDCESDASKCGSHAGTDTNMDEFSDLREFDSSTSLDISSINFSFKNLSQLASMNYDALRQTGKTSKCTSPTQAPST